MKKHKKVIFMILSLVFILLFSFAVTAESKTLTDGNWKYELLEDGTAKITKYTGKAAEVTVPSEIGDITVTALGKELFRGVEKTEKVTVPDSVVTMENTFYMAENVKEIHIGKGLEELTGNVFYCAWNLENITVSEENESFTSVDGILYSKDMKRLITVPSGIKTKTLTIPESVEILSKNAMRDVNISSLKLPSTLKTIESYAISVSDLANLIIPGSVEELQMWAVYACNDLVTVEFEEGSLTEICDMFFENCSKLEMLIIPSNIEKIGTFMECPSIKMYGISEDNKALTSMDGVLFNKDMTEIISYPCGKPENTYTIPDTVETIGEKSFMGAKNLATIYIPKSVKVIEPLAFAYCLALTDVYYAGTKAQFGKIKIDEETVFFNNVIYVGDHVHSFDNASVVKKATNKANGKVKYTCSCGESKSETVYKISSVKLSTTKYTYNGKQKSPSVEVKDSKGKTLKKGTDYTVKYASGRKNPGRYKVTVTFKGKYEYKKELSFVIAPKTPTLKVSASKTKVTLSYTELAGVTGYQIYYSTDGKTYKKLTALKSEKYTKTLKSGQKYYFKVRGYVKVADGDVIYGAFSSVKSIKIK